MTSIEVFSGRMKRAFPVEPVPQRFFTATHQFVPNDEFDKGLMQRIFGRAWTEVTLLDWRMIASPWVVRDRLEPKTYLYYLPSLLLGGLAETEFLNWALEAIVPNNKNWVPRGVWWHEFAAFVSADQKQILTDFLCLVREEHRDEIHANDDLVRAGKAIWRE